MDIITTMRVHTCVYWAPGALDKFGQRAFETPVQMTCRWDDKAVEFVTLEGTRKVSRARVYTELDVLPGGVLWQGTSDTLPDPARPLANSGAMLICHFEKIATLDGTEYLRTAYT